MRASFNTFNHAFTPIYTPVKQKNQLNNYQSFSSNYGPGKESKSIKDFYVGGGIFHKWEEQATKTKTGTDKVGSAVVPSVCSKQYQQEMVELLESRLPENGKLLSVGCGVGCIEKILNDKNKFNITCVDKFQEAIDIIEAKGLKGIVASGDDLHKIPDKSQDVVYMDGSIGHMVPDSTIDFIERTLPKVKFQCPLFPKCSAEPKRYPGQPYDTEPPYYLQAPLREAYKKLKPGGSMIISDDRPAKGEAIELNPRVRLLRVSPEQLITELDQAGFKYDEIREIPYHRPGFGMVVRSIIIAKKPVY